MESPVATRTVCSPTRFPWKAGHAARSILSRLGDAPSRGVNRLYVAADVRIDFGTLIRACSRTTLLPPVGQGGTGRCCMASRARDRAPFSMNDDVHVGSRACGTRQGVLGAPGGRWVAGIALARWLQLVVAAPRNLSANVSMVSQHSSA